MTSNKPLTLGELTDFFLTGWPLVDVLDMNFDDDLECSICCFEAKSEFYPDLDRLCRQSMSEVFLCST
ncbi:MAG TPA: hypothetical protein VMX97_08990 [Hyphomicrobiaceae bacterium]|nr:hypothetical protein [Hyphomicrobiaceae bacterium]